MNLEQSEIKRKLNQLAFDRTTPFCYSCYSDAPSGVCEKCGSDDLMRRLEGVGVEYGTDWIIKHILAEELEPVDLNEAFEETLRQIYPETVNIGFLNDFDTVRAMKELDAAGWRCALSDWESQEEDDGTIFSIDNGKTYYWTHEIEFLLNEYLP